MRTRASIAVAALVGAAALSASPAGAHAGTPRPPQGTRLLLTFDHHESLLAGTTVRDSSRRHHPGTVIASHVAGLRTVHGRFLRGAGFPRLCRGCGHVIVEVPDAPGLNPLRRAFLFGADVRIGARRAATGSNFMQKGRYNQAGGQFKLNLRPGGIPRCVVRGAVSRIVVVGRASVADGSWHRVSCLRTPTGVRLRVDGKRVGAVQGVTGLVANDQSMRIGGRKSTAPNRQYHGSLDTAFFRVLPRQ
jgi:hypothetical protein